MKKIKICYFICVLISNYSLYSQQNDILNSAKFVHHKPVVTSLYKNLESQLTVFYKLDIPNKFYIVNDLGNQIRKFKEEPLSKIDTSVTEMNFIKLLKDVDTLKTIKRIILFTWGGENARFFDYAFIETQDSCFCNRNNGRDTLIAGTCKIKSLNVFLDYLKRNPMPKKKYLEDISNDKNFWIYEITEKTIYANQFFDTYEYYYFIKSTIGL